MDKTVLQRQIRSDLIVSDKLVELAFKRAQENGELDDLPGTGKPIKPSSLTTDPFAHVYRESGTMTPNGSLQRQIKAARERLARETDAGRRRLIETELAQLETRTAVEMESFKRYM